MFCDMDSNLVCCNSQRSSEWEMMVNYLKEMLMKPYPKALTICPRRFWTWNGKLTISNYRVLQKQNTFWQYNVQNQKIKSIVSILTLFFGFINNSMLYFIFLCNWSKLHCDMVLEAVFRLCLRDPEFYVTSHYCARKWLLINNAC